MNFEIIDHNIIPDLYVVYIVDIWVGDRNDPATAVTRFIGTWGADQLETEEKGAFDPDFSFGGKEMRSYYLTSGDSFPRDCRPIQWDQLDVIQSSDNAFAQHKQQSAQLEQQSKAENGNSWAFRTSGGVTYEQFLDAIDTLAVDEENEEAWVKVDAWRQRQMQEEERAPR